MKNHYLKAESEEALWGALEAAGLAKKVYDPDDPLNQPDDIEGWEPSGAFGWQFMGEALDLIGTIYRPTGNTLTDEEGSESPEMAPLDGFHANLIADDAEGLPTIDEPAHPYRVWA